MKRFAFLAIAALTLIGCAKEIDRVPEAAKAKTHTVTITAGFDETRTAYGENGKFSWLPGDRIGVLCAKDGEIRVFPFTTVNGGYEAEFTGEVEDGYAPSTGIATYPFTETQDGYACNDFAYNTENGNIGFRLWGSFKPDPVNPLSSLPLAGVADEGGLYHFKTACGILKFTVVNASQDMMYSYLETPNDSEAFLNGWFSLGDNNYLEMSNALKGYHERYNWNVPSDYGENLDVYFFLPVGTLPAGTKFELCDSGWTAMESFTFKKDVEVVRNAIVEIEPIVLEGDVSLGKCLFRDNYIWPAAGLEDYVEAEIFQFANNPNKFRIEKPYPGEGSGKWFVIDISDPGAVASLPYFLDMDITSEAGVSFKPWVRNGDYGYNYSDVLKWQPNGLPANIEIGPCYRGDDFLEKGYDYEIGLDHYANVIEIIFPGCEPYEYHYGDKIELTADMLSPIATETTEGSVAGLCDGIVSDSDSNTWYWHSPWSTVGTYDPDYGIYIDIDLGEGKQEKDMALFFCFRPVMNDHAMHVRVLGSNDKTSWTKLAENGNVYRAAEKDENGVVLTNQWTPAFNCHAAEPVRYLRLAILSSYNLYYNGISDLTNPKSAGCTHIAELYLMRMLPGAE